MFDLQNIKLVIANGVMHITLNRVHKRNAIDEQTMDEWLSIMNRAANIKITAAVLRANGDDFCVGADLNWIRNTQNMDEETLIQQNLKLQNCFRLWHELPAFTIALVHGNAFGGGLGLVAGSDLVIARPSARFRFPEVTLGLIPALVAPFVLQRTNHRYIRNAMMTAMSFDSNEALKYGLADSIADQPTAEDMVDHYLTMLENVDSNALSQCKRLLNDITANNLRLPVDIHTARLLAAMRNTEQASRRIDNFFKSQDKKNGNT
jgi:methylglutaconyl-CoA hydratase